MLRRFFLRQLADATPGGDHVPDGELLRRFVGERDAAAVELLICRHADVVWTVCRRVLASEADAEDAFQATFLALARKAGTVRGANVGGWLHRVAVNTALKLRARQARVVIASPEHLGSLPAPANDGLGSDLSAVIQEELASLPDRFRLPVVLCEIEGRTHAEAAQALGWPVGSVSSRLSRARALLRRRLTRRGFSPAGVVLPALGPPTSLVRDATAVSVGAASAPPRVSKLTEGTLSMMRFTQLKLAAVKTAAVAAVALAGFGTYTAMGQRPGPPGGSSSASAAPQGPPTISPAGDSITAYPGLDPKSLEDLVENCPKTLGGRKTPPGPAAVPIGPNDPALVQLQKARLNAALADLAVAIQQIQSGRQLNAAAAIPEACNRAAASAADVFPPNELAPWYEERVRVAKWHELVTEAQVKAARKAGSDLNAARYARLDAEIALLKLTARKAPGGGQ